MLSSRELSERGEPGRARSGPRQHVVQGEEHSGASGAAAAVEMDPVSIANDLLAQIDESHERLAPRHPVVGHRQAYVLDRAANHQPCRKLLFGLGRPDGDLGGAGGRHTVLVVLRDREELRGRNLLDLLDLSQLVGADPG